MNFHINKFFIDTLGPRFRNFIILLLCVTFYILPIIYNFTIFETNDDFGMMLLSEGSISDKSTENLVYTSELFGLYLKTLYTAFPNISWYPLTQLVMKVISSYALILISLNMLKSVKDKTSRALFQTALIVIPIIIYPEFWYSYQFTATSIIAAGSGFLYFVFYKRKNFIIPLVLITLGILLRLESGVIILTFLILTQLYLSYFHYKNLNTSKKDMGFIAFIFFLFAIMMVVIIPKHFSNTEYIKYQEFNSARGAVHGYMPSPSVVVTSKEAKKILNWSKNDYNLFYENFFYGDQNVYSLNKIQQLIEVQKSKLASEGISSIPKYFFSTFFPQYKESFLIYFFFVFILLNLISYSRDKILFTFIFFSPFLLISYFFVIHIQGRVPARIFYPSITIFLLYILFASMRSSNFNSSIVFRHSKSRWKSRVTLYGKYYDKVLILVLNLLCSIIIAYFINFYFNILRFNNFILVLILFSISLICLNRLYLNKLNTFGKLSLLVLVFSIMIINYGRNSFYFENTQNIAKMRKYDSLNYNDVYNYRGDLPIVAFSSFYSPLMEFLNPFDAPKSRAHFFRKVVFIGSHLYSPAVNSQLENNSISTALFLEVARGDALLGVGNNLEIQKASQFVLEHYGIKISWPTTPIFYSANNIQIWSVN